MGRRLYDRSGLLSEDLRCKTHPHVIATKNCERCGDFLCEDCSIVNGASYCPNCLKKVELQALKSVRRIAAFKANFLTLLVLVLLLSLGSNWSDFSFEGFTLVLVCLFLMPYTTFLAFLVQRFASRDGGQLDLIGSARLKIFMVVPFVALILTWPISLLFAVALGDFEQVALFSLLSALLILWATHWTVRLTLRALNQKFQFKGGQSQDGGIF